MAFLVGMKMVCVGFLYATATSTAHIGKYCSDVSNYTEQEKIGDRIVPLLNNLFEISSCDNNLNTRKYCPGRVSMQKLC